MKFILFLAVFSIAFADIYLHNPRGSNNRNRGSGVNVDNANRLFDSQNNNKGGYCWGPAMTYYEGSMLQIEWTAQHGCGVEHPNVDCDLILQFMCHRELRDGIEEGTINAANRNEKATDPKTGSEAYKFGMQEPFEFYDKCSKRLRNKGLFIADQNLPATSTALRTRQDNNEGNPHGFECTEERDYYPYWHPSPWRDIAVLTSDPSRCAYFKTESQNVKEKFDCSKPEFNNQSDCENGGGTWVVTRPWGMDPPECIANGFSRDNHLGNTKTGFTNIYNWVIPRLTVMAPEYRNTDGDSANCAFRIRYNISTGDTRGWRHVDDNEPMLDSSFNNDRSPVKQDPYVIFGETNGIDRPLRLALNTDQYGRTFQDRSHMFKIARRPRGVSEVHRIINLNVRGKRGNIVQAYPAVEYDFVPNNLQINVGDFVHFQWTGCDTNPNYAGEGTQGTDRSNIVQIENPRDNYPVPFNKQTMFEPVTAMYMAHINQFDGRICQTVDDTGCCFTLDQLKTVGGNVNENIQNCAKLNDPKRQYFDGGVVQMNTPGTYYYMSSRNNNFSNRSQKGSITVGSVLPVWGIVVAAVGGVGFVGACVVAGGAYFAQTHPTGTIANLFGGVQV